MIALARCLQVNTAPPEYRIRQRGVSKSTDDDAHEGATHRAARDDEPSETKAKTVDSENSGIAASTDPPARPKSDKTEQVTAHTKQAATTENSSIAVVASRTNTAEAARSKAEVRLKAGTAAESSSVGCTKYFPAVGLTLSVPCDPK